MPDELLKAIQALSDQAEALAEKVDIAARIQKRLSAWVRVVVALAVTSILLALVSIGLYIQGHTAVTTAREASVSICQNGNEFRAAQLALWQTIFAIPNPGATSAEKHRVALLSAWINQVYAQHDCTDLTKKYPIPEPPTLG